MPTPENVRVYLRFRPPNEEELREGRSTCARVNESGKTVTLADGGLQHEFKFDRVFDEDASQADVHDAAAAPLVDAFLSGKNCCIMTYGHPGSGKTHTLMSPPPGSSPLSAAGRGEAAAGAGAGTLRADLDGDGGNDQSVGDVSSLGSSGASEARPAVHAPRPRDAAAPGSSPSPPTQVFTTGPRAGGHAPGHLPLHPTMSDGGEELLSNPLMPGPTPMQRMIKATSQRMGRRESMDAVCGGEGAQQSVPGERQNDEGNVGIAQRIVRDVFLSTPTEQLQGEGENDGEDDFVKVRCSFVEIFVDDERLVDLLASGDGKDAADDGSSIAIKKDEDLGGVRIEGAKERLCVDESEVLKLLDQGNAVRLKREAEKRERSHALFTIDFERHSPATSSMYKSRMFLIDLGGDMVNKSLSTLGNVIYALTERSQSHVPYDDSIITSILKNAFGGNSKTSLILTASPSSCCVQETVSTIRFGQRAKHVINKVKSNRVAVSQKEKNDHPVSTKNIAVSSDKLDVPADLSSPAEDTLDTAQTDESSANSKEAYDKLMRAKAMLQSKSQESNKSLATESVQGAAKQMEADLWSARQELSTVSNLLRSAAERMEADLSAAKKELIQPSSAQDFANQNVGMESELLTTKAALGSFTLEENESLELPLHLTAQQISLDLEAARKELLGVTADLGKKQPVDTDPDTKLNGAGQTVSEVKKESKDTSSDPRTSTSCSPEKLVESGDVETNADMASPKHRKKEEAMEKEIAALRKENEALNRVKKKRDEELLRAKKEIKILTLRATEAEKTIRKADYRDPKYSDGINRTAPMTAEDAKARASEENLGVSNIVSGQFQSDSTNDADSASHRTDDMLIDKENIRVCLRLRPMSKLETSRRSRVCFDIHEGSENFTVESLSGEYDFSYDKAFDSDASQSAVYAFTGTPVVSALLSGVNCCVMVYGLTSSGKTYTLMGRLPDASGRDADDLEESKDLSKFQDSSDADNDPKAGIAPRLIKDLFRGIAEGSETNEFTIKCSYVGIYLEKMFDLLQSQVRINLFVRDDPKGIQVEGACEACCFDESDVFALLQRGQACLAVLAHRMNVDINRSHSIFIIKIEQRDIKTGAVKTAQLHLADLAGFEMPVKTKGQTMQELKIVHKSFSALGNVIKSLMENNIHAPYRESKLTCILKDALGGNCKTTLIVTASPSSYSISETVNTVRIGQRLRQVVNVPRVNREVSVEDYKKWLMTTEVKLGELVSFVKELVGAFHRAGNGEKSGEASAHAEQILSSELLESITAIVEEEDNVNNPCRQALSLGDLEEIQKCGAKWKALSSEIVTRIRPDDLTEIAKARAKAESLLSDIQSEVVVLRRQNDLLVQDKRKRGEELSKLKKEVKLLKLRIAELEHNLNLSEYREKEAGVFLRHLRKICWNLQKDIHTERATEISEITASLSGAPNLTGLVDLDTLLLEAGLIGTRDIEEEDFDDEDDETNFLDWSQTRESKHNGDSRNDTSGLNLSEAGRQDHPNASAGLSIIKGVSTFLRKGADPSEPSDADDSSATQPMHHMSSHKQRKLQRDLRNMTNKCVELQMLLNEERERMNCLTNRARSLDVKNLSQEVVALGKERDRMKHYAKAATWKLQELHVVNKVLSKKGKETSEHVSSLEEGFQRLQETFRTTVLDSLEADSQLNEKITSLEAVVDTLTVPQNQNMGLDVLARPVPRMNLPLRGRLERRKDGGGPHDPNIPTPGARCLMLANRLKLPEKTPSSCVRRVSKYRRRIKKTGDAGAAGVGKAALASNIQKCRRLGSPRFTGNLFVIENLLSFEY